MVEKIEKEENKKNPKTHLRNRGNSEDNNQTDLLKKLNLKRNKGSFPRRRDWATRENCR